MVKLTVKYVRKNKKKIRGNVKIAFFTVQKKLIKMKTKFILNFKNYKININVCSFFCSNGFFKNIFKFPCRNQASKVISKN